LFLRHLLLQIGGANIENPPTSSHSSPLGLVVASLPRILRSLAEEERPARSSSTQLAAGAGARCARAICVGTAARDFPTLAARSRVTLQSAAWNRKRVASTYSVVQARTLTGCSRHTPARYEAAESA
jgi:hypothetical protein